MAWAFAALLIWTSGAVAQSEHSAAGMVRDAASVSSAADRPAEPAEIDAPEPQPSAGASSKGLFGTAVAVPQDQPGGTEVAPIHTKYILPNMRAQPLTKRDKLIIGLEDTYSPLNFGGILVASGYQQLRNGIPNYGSDRGAFGERLGAAGIRDTLQGFLTDGVFAPMLHQDSRFYVEGRHYGVFHRVWYAVTRPVISRSDDGRRVINGAQLLAYGSVSILNNAYYPQANRNVRDTAEAFATSLGGSAASAVMTEFTASLWAGMNFWHKR